MCRYVYLKIDGNLWGNARRAYPDRKDFPGILIDHIINMELIHLLAVSVEVHQILIAMILIIRGSLKATYVGELARDDNESLIIKIKLKCLHLLIESFFKYLLIILLFSLQLHNITHITFAYTLSTPKENIVAFLIDKYVFQPVFLNWIYSSWFSQHYLQILIKN